MHYPAFADILELRDSAMQQQPSRRLLLPIYSDILADMETPVSAYCKTAQQPYSFLLESVSGGEHVARYSFIGINPYLVMIQRGETAQLKHMHYSMEDDHLVAISADEIVSCHDPLSLIEAELNQYQLVELPHTAQNELPKFYGGGVGYLAYETIARFERIPVPELNTLDLPLAVMSFTETVLVFDHVKHRVRAVTHLH